MPIVSLLRCRGRPGRRRTRRRQCATWGRLAEGNVSRGSRRCARSGVARRARGLRTADILTGGRGGRRRFERAAAIRNAGSDCCVAGRGSRRVASAIRGLNFPFAGGLRDAAILASRVAGPQGHEQQRRGHGERRPNEATCAARFAPGIAAIWQRENAGRCVGRVLSHDFCQDAVPQIAAQRNARQRLHRFGGGLQRGERLPRRFIGAQPVVNERRALWASARCRRTRSTGRRRIRCSVVNRP